MDELKKLHRGEMDLQGLRRRQRRGAPPDEDQPAPEPGQGRLAGPALGRRERARASGTSWANPAHKVINAHLYQADEVLALYRRISMPVLAVEASDNSLDLWWKGKFTLEQYHERIQNVPNVEIALHSRRRPHDAPRPARAAGRDDRALYRLRRAG